LKLEKFRGKVINLGERSAEFYWRLSRQGEAYKGLFFVHIPARVSRKLHLGYRELVRVKIEKLSPRELEELRKEASG